MSQAPRTVRYGGLSVPIPASVCYHCLMTQEQAFSILKTGASVFLTGEAGSGKTHVVNRYAAYLRERGIPYAMTASTGIAATHIRGMTVHSWSGVGVHTDIDEEGFRKLAKNGPAIGRIRSARVLVIDEISMLDARAFSLIERMYRHARGGGIDSLRRTPGGPRRRLFPVAAGLA